MQPVEKKSASFAPFTSGLWGSTAALRPLAFVSSIQSTEPEVMMRCFITLLSSFLTLAGPAAALDSTQGNLAVNLLASGLDQPWAVEVLPSGDMLITERAGRLLRRAPDGQISRIANVPKVVDQGQGGLLDLMIPRDFATSREVFLSYSKRQGRGSGTALSVGRLNEAGTALENVQLLFEMAPGSSGGRHFGSRIVEASDGTIFLTTGDRGDRPSAQDLRVHSGKVIRINRDGSVPQDNPFVTQPDALPEIWSLGHRNPQGAALDLNGNLWTSAHGAKGGDEVNRIGGGDNYGWPVISYGRHYSGAKIGVGVEASGMRQPEHYWDPSIAPSGMMIYSGKLWPEWRGDIFVGSLKFDMISRLDGKTFAEERLQSSQTGRVRDIIEGPNGEILFLSVEDGALYAVTPE
jgi:glucose/arabinose dehydrogenase